METIGFQIKSTWILFVQLKHEISTWWNRHSDQKREMWLFCGTSLQNKKRHSNEKNWKNVIEMFDDNALFLFFEPVFLSECFFTSIFMFCFYSFSREYVHKISFLNRMHKLSCLSFKPMTNDEINFLNNRNIFLISEREKMFKNFIYE